MQITQNFVTYNIPDGIDEELVRLILNTNSLDPEEKKYWFDEFPKMDNKSIQRIKDILVIERNKLADIESKYISEIEALNKEYLSKKPFSIKTLIGKLKF